jgi:glycogen operon protein
MAAALLGSPDLYSSRGPTASINFITCHDGFTLMDLVSYNGKHNEANSENNNDGANDNNCWNCGSEGPADGPAVSALRRQQIKNAIAMLLVSQGVPMILMGDEMGRTQGGNNNTYCHDNDLNWLDWSLLDCNHDLYHFTRNCIRFRQNHDVLRGREHLRNQDYLGTGYPDVSWHGTQVWKPDWRGNVLAFLLSGRYTREGTANDDFIYVAMNMHWEALALELPQLPESTHWHVFANTSVPQPDDIYEPGQEPLLGNQTSFIAGAHSVAILVGKQISEAPYMV